MIYVGIDIAKLNHFASAISSDGEELIKPFKFTNDNDGFQLLISKLDPLDKDSLIMDSVSNRPSFLTFFNKYNFSLSHSTFSYNFVAFFFRFIDSCTHSIHKTINCLALYFRFIFSFYISHRYYMFDNLCFSYWIFSTCIFSQNLTYNIIITTFSKFFSWSWYTVPSCFSKLILSYIFQFHIIN